MGPRVARQCDKPVTQLIQREHSGGRKGKTVEAGPSVRGKEDQGLSCGGRHTRSRGDYLRVRWRGKPREDVRGD